MNQDTEHLSALADEATAFLKAFAHPARLIICCQLKHGEMSVGEIEESLDIRQPRLSRELAKLREAGIVDTRRDARAIFYRLSDDPRVRAMIESVCAIMLGKPIARPGPDLPRHRVRADGGFGVFARTGVSPFTNVKGGS